MNTVFSPSIFFCLGDKNVVSFSLDSPRSTNPLGERSLRRQTVCRVRETRCSELFRNKRFRLIMYDMVQQPLRMKCNGRCVAVPLHLSLSLAEDEELRGRWRSCEGF